MNRRSRLGRVRAIALTALLLATTAPAGELGGLLRSSLAHPGIQEARLHAQAAREVLLADRARSFGSGAAYAETARSEDQRFVGVLSPSSLSAPPFARDVIRYGLSYRIPVDLSGALRASRQAAAHEAAAAQLVERQTVLLKLADTVATYVHMQALLRQDRALSVQADRVAQTRERTARQVQTQQSSIAELKQAEAEVGKLRAEQIRLQGAMQLAQARLEESCGRTLIPSTFDIRIPAWNPVLPGQLIPGAIAEQQALGATAQARALERTLWPSALAEADYTQFDGDTDADDAWSVMARFSIPLDLSARRRAGAARQSALAAQQARIAASRTAIRDWASLAASYRSAMADAEALHQEIVAREDVVQVQAELQRVGLASLEDLLRQQRDLLDAESRRGAAQAQAVAAWASAQILAGAGVEWFIGELDAPIADSPAPQTQGRPLPRNEQP